MKRMQFDLESSKVERFFRKARKLNLNVDLAEVNEDNELVVNVTYEESQKVEFRKLENWFDEEQLIESEENDD